MRVAVISDAHGNLTALRAVIADIERVGVDRIVHAGDLVGPGSSPEGVVDLVASRGWSGVVGNTDEMIGRIDRFDALTARAPARAAMWDVIRADNDVVRAALGDARATWLASLPLRLADQGFTVVHASPDDPWITPGADSAEHELERVFGGLNAKLVVHGHTHLPAVRRLSGFTLANSGSVGVPYDGDPRACWLLIDDGRASVQRVAYDVEEEARKMGARGYTRPDWLATTLRSGRPARLE